MFGNDQGIERLERQRPSNVRHHAIKAMFPRGRGLAHTWADAKVKLGQWERTWGCLPPNERIALFNHHAPFWVSLALVSALGYYAAQLVWALVPGPTASWVAPPAHDEREPDRAAVHSRYGPIVAAHLFGEVTVSAAPPQDFAQASPTTEALTLRGVVASSDPNIAHALIADPTTGEQVYFLQAELPGGLKLAHILPDRVILDRGGQLEALLLPGAPDSFFGDRQREIPRIVAASMRLDDSVEGTPLPVATRFSDVLMRRPRIVRGEFRGIEVFAGAAPEQFTALGLRSGDLITAIDGRGLTAGDLETAFQSAVGTARLTLTIERQGHTQQLNIIEGQLMAENVPSR